MNIELNKGSFGLEETYQTIKNIIDKKHPNSAKRSIMVVNNTAYATNGRVLIKYEILGEDGFYIPVSCRKTNIVLTQVQDIINFPDCDAIFDICNTYSSDDIFHAYSYKKKMYKFNTHLPIEFAIDTGIGLNYENTNIAVELVCESISYKTTKDPVLFNFGNTTKLVIMPLILAEKE